MVPGFKIIMMTSSNGNIFRVSGLLCGEFTGHRWIPHTKASDAELWCFLWYAPEPTAAQTMGTSVIWDTIALSMTSLLWCILIWKIAVYMYLQLKPLEDEYIPQFYRNLFTLRIMSDDVIWWVPCWPHELCCLGCFTEKIVVGVYVIENLAIFQRLLKLVKVWIKNYLHASQWDWTTYPCSDFSGGFVSVTTYTYLDLSQTMLIKMMTRILICELRIWWSHFCRAVSVFVIVL